jgi:hypothetical protein
VCPQSPFWDLKNCGAQTKCGLLQIMVKLWHFFFDVDRWNRWPSLRFSVSCLWNGDFFQEQTINGNTYLDMMQLHAVPQIEHLQPHILQPDSAPPHWGLQVRACLDRTFPGTWIGREGTTPWPPRSPDITPQNFFLWGYIKSNVFRTPVNGLDDLKSHIRIFQRTCSTEHGKSSNIV